MRAGRTLVLLAALALAACGDSGSDDGAAAGPEKVRIGETAGVPTAFLQFGVAKGFFAKAGIELDVRPVEGAAPIVTGVVSGDYDMGGSDTVTFATAIGRRLPLTMIAPGTSATDDDAADFSSILVRKGSPIREPADLAGKTIAVNILANIGEVTIRGALDRLGVDPRSVRFTEVPFPEMATAVQRGDVDAAWIIEPFQTIALSAGLRRILSPYATFQPGLQIGSIVTTRRYAEERSDVVRDFQRAHRETAAYIARHPGEFRAALPRIAKLEPGLARSVILPVWRQRVDRRAVDRVAAGMLRYGLVNEKPAATSAIHPDS